MPDLPERQKMNTPYTVTVDDETREVAMGLSGWNNPSGALLQISPGVLVPHWVAYVSRATILIAERKAFGSKK